MCQICCFLSQILLDLSSNQTLQRVLLSIGLDPVIRNRIYYGSGFDSRQVTVPVPAPAPCRDHFLKSRFETKKFIQNLAFLMPIDAALLPINLSSHLL